MDKNSVHLAFAADNNYAQHFGIALISIFKSTSEPSRLYIHLLDCGIDDKNKIIIENIVADYGATLNFYSVSSSAYVDLPIIEHITAAAYARLKIPTIISENVSKIIYLDCDVLVLSDIIELWNFDLGESPLGAVVEPGQRHEKRLELPTGTPYFNSGVLVLNLQEFRRHLFMEKVEQFARNFPERLVCGDQDALNVILFGNWVALNPLWNYVAWYYTPEVRLQFPHFSRSKPSLVHFTASPKPWHYLCEHPLRSIYCNYLSDSAWKDFRFPDKTFMNMIRKNFRNLLPLRLRVYIRKYRSKF